MESSTKKSKSWKQVVRVGVLTLTAVAFLVARLQTKTSVLAESAQMTFKSPDEAGAALAKAAMSGDPDALANILGADAKALLTTEDKEADKAAMDAFVYKYEKMHRWVDMDDGSRVLYIGTDNFAFPVPLAKHSSGEWYLDAVAGAQEIRARQIGRNELLAIDACAAIANAEDVYFTSAGYPPQFAQRIVSTAGRQDGLYWATSEKMPVSSPLGSLHEFPKHSLGGKPVQEPLVMDGYTFRILTAQGDAAPGGAKSYIVNGKMTGGFAILAAPVKYAETGIMTFMTGSDGLIYERDLGPDTVKIAASIQRFNPTDDWSPVE